VDYIVTRSMTGRASAGRQSTIFLSALEGPLRVVIGSETMACAAAYDTVDRMLYLNGIYL